MALPHENIVAAFGASVPCLMTMTFVGAAPDDEPLPEPLPDEPLPEEPVPDELLPEEPVPAVELLLDGTDAPADEAEGVLGDAAPVAPPLPQADNARTTAAAAIVRNCQTCFVLMTLLPRACP